MLSISHCTLKLTYRNLFFPIGRFLVHLPKIHRASQVSVRHQQSFRTLFELHAGRREHEPPEDLVVDEGRSFSNDKNKHPRSTSKDLIEALGPIGIEYETLQDYAHQNDLSYSDPLTAILDWREARRQVWINSQSVRDWKWGSHPKDVLVDYLRHVFPVLEYQARSGNTSTSDLDDALRKVFYHRNESYFKKRGWDVTDLMDWSWILTGNTTERAAARLALVGRLGLENSGKHKVIPLFLPAFLLRRRSISAPALSKILEYLCDFMPWLSEQKSRADEKKTESEMAAQDKPRHHPGIKDFIFMIIIVRLLRRARAVMPAAFESIASLLCRYLDDCIVLRNQDGEKDNVETHLAALTFTYNSALALVAYPAFLRPFRSATHQQRAQFMILRKMNQYNPPLLVDRRGYRAVTRVLLMQKKTSRDREWATFKALSWPPWKEDRLGIDADIGPEFGISQAKEVLNQAKEAGYAADDWDDAASILAGWDTDDSPTIQTRAVLRGKIPPDFSHNSAKSRSHRFKSMVWATRIKATRTLQEAWAAFLSHEDSGIQKNQVVYYAMFEKLFHDAKRTSFERKFDQLQFEDPRTGKSLPGDGLEISPTPTAPRHTVYNRISPPSIEEFFQKMIENGIRPKAQGGFLSMLLRNAPTLNLGFQFLAASTLPREHTTALLTPSPNTNEDSETQELIREVPKNTFTAVIELLTRTTWVGLHLTDETDFGNSGHSKSGMSPEGQNSSQIMARSWSPASQAIWLVLQRQPCERRPWYAVLASLARSGVVSPMDTCSEFGSHYSAIANWKTSCTILNVMEDLDVKHDIVILKILCTGLEKAIFEAENIASQRNGLENLEDDLRADLNLVLGVGLSRVKNIFKDIVRSARMQQDIPQSIIQSQYLEKLDPKGRPQKPKILPSDDDNDGNDDDTDDSDEDLEEDLEEGIGPSSRVPDSFLPPACLLPQLLEVPDPAQLHSFIRVLGLRRDYQGILDLIEWMALYSDEIRAMMEDQQNGSRMMRRCLTATRVFLERSWLSYHDADDEKSCLDENGADIEPAPLEISQNVRDTILETQHWGGWPTDAEVERYCLKGRFL